MRHAALAAIICLSAGCQSFLDRSDAADVSVHPSKTPQIVSEVSKADPKAKLGAQEHPRILSAYGGAYHDDDLDRLVARIVGALTAVSDNPDQTYRITVLDSPSVNAFALPGGYIYVSRGLLALADDASEVAAVISHEMGHVTANHGIERQHFEETQHLNQRVVDEVLSNRLESNAMRAQNKLKLAAFSRQQELQADRIGAHMLGRAGYDPYAAARFLKTMAEYADFVASDPNRDSSLDFLSSHPNTPERIKRVRAYAEEFGKPGTVGSRGQDYFLDGIEGLRFGDKPKDGYVRGQVFLHPDLGIRFAVPKGFTLRNTDNAVLASGPDDLAVRFDAVDADGKGSLEDYVDSGWINGLDPSSIKHTTIAGMPAVTGRAMADQWQFDVTVIRFNGRIYRFLTAAPRDSDRLEDVANAVRSSFRRMTQSEIASVGPLRVRVTRVAPGDTVATFAARMQGTVDKERLFRILNGLGPTETLKPGERVKYIAQ
ncbi:M48 family metalloprotease [Pararhizobium mangrovi]|uniref:Metalloprotease n=1 Tax=Pararhizobium mangrovi TaxID=2590452 RepID=A0A506UC94_9HYPH|nr:M48 family metalloprotease [Pararhizobium mangrovi]TPW30731.1 metalloprotease [Pararhizobium mangrovi]